MLLAGTCVGEGLRAVSTGDALRKALTGVWLIDARRRGPRRAQCTQQRASSEDPRVRLHETGGRVGQPVVFRFDALLQACRRATG